MKKYFISNVFANPNEKELVYYVLSDGQFMVYNEFSEVYSIDTQLVSFDWDVLVDWLRANKKPIHLNLIDLEQAFKQSYGRKRKNNAPLLPWSIWIILQAYYDDDQIENLECVKKFYFGLEKGEEDDVNRIYAQFLRAMAQCYEDLMVDLETKKEFNRFMTIERPVRIINLERTYKGITVNTTNMSEWINDLTKNIYYLRNRLQLTYGIISTGDRSTVINKIIANIKIQEIQEIIDERGYYFFLKDTKSRHELINLLYQEKKASADLNVLLAIGALNPKNKKIYPIFDSFGTITARTKLITPSLQNLSKKYRKIIDAEKGKDLIYIDYAQFEAGILAHDCKDQSLLNEYNTSDIYTEIGKKINIANYLPNSEDQRKFCKSLFYKYSYGMNIENHRSVLLDFNIEDRSGELSPLISKAFKGYETLEIYRNKIQESLLFENAIGTFDGNFRYKLENEKRTPWALSQRIQGTASMILKMAIIKLRKIDPSIEFLIPMHDAALFQVPEDELDAKKIIVKTVFEETFSDVCSDIKTRANFKEFSE